MKKPDKNTKDSSKYEILETLKHPVSIIDKDGNLIYGNSAFRKVLNPGDNDIRLDWDHPFFPEYRAYGRSSESSRQLPLTRSSPFESAFQY